MSSENTVEEYFGYTILGLITVVGLCVLKRVCSSCISWRRHREIVNSTNRQTNMIKEQLYLQQQQFQQFQREQEIQEQEIQEQQIQEQQIKKQQIKKQKIKEELSKNITRPSKDLRDQIINELVQEYLNLTTEENVKIEDVYKWYNNFIQNEDIKQIKADLVLFKI
jgi:TolA-binding protein